MRIFTDLDGGVGVYRSPTPTDKFITTPGQTDGAGFGNLSGVRSEGRAP